MNKKTVISKLKNLLLSEKDELLKQSKQEIDIDVDGDETDEIQGATLTNILKQLNNRNLAKLNLIDSALKRMADGTYGKCQDCDELIPEKRLQANPYCQTCVMCAEDRELEEKRKVSR